MNNGVGESGSHHHQNQRRESQLQSQGKRKLNDFAYAIARMSVAQICESVEVNSYQESQTSSSRFSSFQESALETLTDVAVQYIENIGKAAHLYGNLAGRVEGNGLDIVQALEDLGSGLGFGGVSESNRCLADSGVVKEIVRYTREAEEIPFVYALPRFPVNKEKRASPSFSEVGVEPPDEHIPVWLPAFPETKGTTEGEEVPSKENGSTLSTFDNRRLEVLKPPKDVAQKQITEVEVEGGNPFLTAPVRFVEKEVSQPVLFSKDVLDKHMSNNNHHIPILEASASLDEINKKKNKLAQSEDEEKKKDDSRTQRSSIRFKIGNSKRPMCLPINRSFQEQDWFQESEEDKREKKKSEIKETKRERIELQSIDSDVK